MSVRESVSNLEARYQAAGMEREPAVVVSIRRGCPNSPNPCNCPGTCREPVTREEAVRALKRKLDELDPPGTRTSGG